MKTIAWDAYEALKERLLARGDGDFAREEQIVMALLEDVRRRGDQALFAYAQKFDGFLAAKDNIWVTEQEIEEALGEIPQDLLQVVRESGENIRAYHQLQKRDDFALEKEGVSLRQIIRPLERVGVYVPGGKAAYPSSVLMNIIPAKVAGVEEVIMATPAKEDGRIAPLTLAAAHIAGADRILKIGGAQAVAALAYGTESVPRVDKITGPGNIFVALAKKRVFGQVGIDMIAGPSEVLIIADDTANPRYLAADFLSQAEHDEQAACILVTDSASLASQVEQEIYAQAEQLPKREIVFQSLENYGTIVLAENLRQAAQVSNLIAPEHLELCVKDPEALLVYIKNAGSIFLGEYAPEPLGDYFAGTNHVLPTNGTARFSSPLSVDDFVKKSSVLQYSREAFLAVADKVERFAKAEGLDAHARSAAIRKED